MEVNEGDDALIGLPPGFRFHPTDEEIVTHYLTPKVLDRSFTASAIGEADLNKSEPWDLPSKHRRSEKAKMGEKEWFFFCVRDRKYPTGMRTNRATESGYWKATGKDKEIVRPAGDLVGMKKTLVFYKGRAPKGEKTNWVMHEFRLEGKFSYYTMPTPSKDEWVVCRVFHKNTGLQRSPTADHGLNPSIDEPLDGRSHLPRLVHPLTPNLDPDRPGSSFTIDESYFSRDQSEILQQEEDYKNILVFSQNYGFDTSTYQASPFMSDPQHADTTAVSGSTRYRSNTDQEEKESILGRCKVEQCIRTTNHSGKISMSQDTGVSNDMQTTIEISSASMSSRVGLGTRGYEPEDHLGSSMFSELDSLLEY